eukprot:Phypoly_transcript_11084.p1 GENE.Phypoly_transcript_11084~~Phypoly_transcript_11084.p1  ORF type:complete len:368 (+),score=48.87 Phypoly_transcript_11084:76-1179(+)
MAAPVTCTWEVPRKAFGPSKIGKTTTRNLTSHATKPTKPHHIYITLIMEDWLPIELKVIIFSMLDSESLFSVSTVCRAWHEVSEESDLWEIHFRAHFPYISHYLLPCQPHHFKQLFAQEHAFLKRARIKSCARDARTKHIQPDSNSNSRISNLINIKMSFLGDAQTGKTTFLLRYVNQQFTPEYYLTTDEDMYKCLASLGGRRVNLLLCDVPGSKSTFSNDPTVNFPVAWDGVDVFILCFSLASKATLDSLVNYWAPLARRIHGMDVPLILCGTMCDAPEFEVTRDDIEEALDALSRYRPVTYVEISSKTGANVEQLITLSLETISPTFFTHSRYYEGPSLDMFRSMRQLGYDYDDDDDYYFSDEEM